MATEDLMARALQALGDDDPLSVEAIHRLTDLADVPESMNIALVADLLDISPHTLRYYERAGLVEVARDSTGYRVYDAQAVRRLVFLTRMRLSGMPMRDLQHYISLVDAGQHTVPERLDRRPARHPPRVRVGLAQHTPSAGLGQARSHSGDVVEQIRKQARTRTRRSRSSAVPSNMGTRVRLRKTVEIVGRWRLPPR